MSLLLDALKRAEQEKLAKGDRPDLQVVGQGEPAGPAAANTPTAANSPAAGAASPHATPNLELQPMAGAAGPSASAPSGAKQQTPAQAQVVVQAKTAAQAQEAGGKRIGLYIAGLAIALAVIAAGVYVWYAMAALAPKSGPRLGAASAPRAPAAGPIAPAPGMPAFSPDKASPAPSAQAAPSSSSAASGPTSTGTVTVTSAPAPEPAPAAAPSREQIAQDLLRTAPRADPPLKLDRTQEPARILPQVANAYEALRQGDLAAARRGYEAALAAEANNVDAHLGIATLEARQGNVAGAARAYRQALETDPRNETALAGLAALAEVARPGTVEAQLRQDVMRSQGSAALRFALGNVLAAQARWSEAQAEYFEAHRLDPGSADIAFNLAVSLDHLGQARLAADFYRRAIESARAQPAQFDAAAAQRRMSELTR